MARIGYLAPTTDFDGMVHTVFARACNIACKCGLLTIAAHDIADGPTVWRLDSVASPDFRALFQPGERLRCRRRVATGRNLTLDLRRAVSWCPDPLPPVSPRQLACNVELATAALAKRRRACSSVIDGDASTSLLALESACRRLDLEGATAEIDRLVGWGEGLTPAGDDAIVGLLAAIGALARADPERASFQRSLSAVVRTRAARTTVVSRHYLRLAAGGHFNADVARLSRALLGGESDNEAAVHRALDEAFNVGATSGADMVSGMIAGLRAWARGNE